MSAMRVDDITKEQIIKKFHTLYRNSAANKVAYGRKSELCSCWLKAEHCKYYDSPQGCHYAHGWSDVQPRIFERNLFKVKPCLRIDKCTYKTRCQFCHDDVVYVLDSQLQVFFSEKEKNYRISLRLENSNILVFTLAEPKFPERDPFVLELKPYFSAMKKKIQAQDPCQMHRNRNNNSNNSDSRRNKNMFQPTLANIVPATSVCTLAGPPQFNIPRAPQPIAVNPHAQPMAPHGYYQINQPAPAYFQNQTYFSPVYPTPAAHPAYRQEPTWVPSGYVYQPQTPQQTINAVPASVEPSPATTPSMQGTPLQPQLQHQMSNQSFTLPQPQLQQQQQPRPSYEITTPTNNATNMVLNNTNTTNTPTAFENLVQSMNLENPNNVQFEQNLLNNYSVNKPAATVHRQIDGAGVQWLGGDVDGLTQQFNNSLHFNEIHPNMNGGGYVHNETISPPPGICETNNLLSTPTRTCKKQAKLGNEDGKENMLSATFANGNVLKLNTRNIQYLQK